MGQKVLYREWRPKTFDEVVGQVHIVNALRQAVKTGELAHAYLFVGTRGTGKTSLAKIFARAVNCLHPTPDGNPCNECEICRGCLDGSLLDVIEMDAASNNSVDNIRKITDEVLFLPTLAKYKVYIIDEVHMLSVQAFNALLKTLEEPPAHVIFIMATTDPQRILPTILSRCQRYDFKRIPAELMQERLALIAKENAIPIDEDGLRTIVARSEGALRDAISLLDQSRSVYSGPIGREEILAMTGVVNDELLEEIVLSLVRGDTDQLLMSLDHLVMEGGDLQRFTLSLTGYFRDLLVCKTSRQPERLLQLPQRTMQTLKSLAPRYSQGGLIRQIAHLTRLQQEMKQAANPRISLEVGLIQMLDQLKIAQRDASEEEIIKSRRSARVRAQDEAADASLAAAAKTATDDEEEAEEAENARGEEEDAAFDFNPADFAAAMDEFSAADSRTKASRAGRAAGAAEDEEEEAELEEVFPEEEEEAPAPARAAQDFPVSDDLSLDFSPASARPQGAPAAERERKNENSRTLDALEARMDALDEMFEAGGEKPQETATQARTEVQTPAPAGPETAPKAAPAGPAEEEVPPPEEEGRGALAEEDETAEEAPLPEEPLDLENGFDGLLMDFRTDGPLTEAPERAAAPESAPDKTPDKARDKAQEARGAAAAAAADNELEAAKAAAVPPGFSSQRLWSDFIGRLSEEDPLMGILLNSYPHAVEGRVLTIEVPADRRAIYDKIKVRKNWALLEQVFLRVKPEGEWHLVCRLAGADEAEEETDDPNMPAWIKKMKRAAEMLDIPLDREE